MQTQPCWSQSLHTALLPVWVRVMGQNVIASHDQLLINTGQELIRLRRAQDPFQGVAADFCHTLCAGLQKEGQQGVDHLGWVQII